MDILRVPFGLSPLVRQGDPHFSRTPTSTGHPATTTGDQKSVGVTNYPRLLQRSSPCPPASAHGDTLWCRV
jgi:hypothetical protein